MASPSDFSVLWGYYPNGDASYPVGPLVGREPGPYTFSSSSHLPRRYRRAARHRPARRTAAEPLVAAASTATFAPVPNLAPAPILPVVGPVAIQQPPPPPPPVAPAPATVRVAPPANQPVVVLAFVLDAFSASVYNRQIWPRSTRQADNLALLPARRNIVFASAGLGGGLHPTRPFRLSHLEAGVGYIVGVVLVGDQRCTRCQRACSPFSECVVVIRIIGGYFFRGACTNCHYYSHGPDCSLHV
ncbi:hypothetical protein BGZ60DRAFT_425268 [Tricladium varicosporioides]|nr:hypothetical protein BGZ60DRAFT_425268 [Hymenoscyphus varicosporioides]